LTSGRQFFFYNHALFISFGIAFPFLSFSLDFEKSVSLDVKNESKVLVIYTGGTIGMVRNEQGVLAPQVMYKLIQGSGHLCWRNHWNGQE
jgi:L-asparaginase/Glu-tRNA(Gln) amidotransferase subunit D